MDPKIHPSSLLVRVLLLYPQPTLIDGSFVYPFLRLFSHFFSFHRIIIGSALAPSSSFWSLYCLPCSRSLYVSLCLFVYQSLSVSLCLFVYQSLSFSLCLYVYVCLYVCLSLCIANVILRDQLCFPFV